MEFLTFIGSAVMSFFSCVKDAIVGLGNKNEGGLLGAASDLAVIGLGAGMLINPTGTGHLIGKIGASAADAIGTTASSVVDNVSDIANSLLKQPWFWVAGGVLVIWLLKD